MARVPIVGEQHAVPAFQSHRILQASIILEEFTDEYSPNCSSKAKRPAELRYSRLSTGFTPERRFTELARFSHHVARRSA